MRHPWGESLIWNFKLAGEVLSMWNSSASAFHTKKFEVEKSCALRVQDKIVFGISPSHGFKCTEVDTTTRLYYSVL